MSFLHSETSVITNFAGWGFCMYQFAVTMWQRFIRRLSSASPVIYTYSSLTPLYNRSPSFFADQGPPPLPRQWFFFHLLILGHKKSKQPWRPSYLSAQFHAVQHLGCPSSLVSCYSTCRALVSSGEVNLFLGVGGGERTSFPGYNEPSCVIISPTVIPIYLSPNYLLTPLLCSMARFWWSEWSYALCLPVEHKPLWSYLICLL